MSKTEWHTLMCDRCDVTARQPVHVFAQSHMCKGRKYKEIALISEAYFDDRDKEQTDEA